MGVFFMCLYVPLNWAYLNISLCVLFICIYMGVFIWVFSLCVYMCP